MTNGTKIRIDADLSGVGSSLNDFRNKAKEAFNNLNGKASIDTASAKRSIEDLEKSVTELHKSLSSSSFAALGAEEIDKISEGFEEAVKHAQELESVVDAMGSGGAASFSKTTAETRKLISELERVKRLQNALKNTTGNSVSFDRAKSIDEEYQRRLAVGGTSTRRFSKFKDLAGVVNNWRDISPFSERQSQRERDNLLDSLGARQTQPSSGGFGQFFKDTARNSVHGVARAVLPNTGVAGSIMRGGTEAAADTEGGLASGAGMARLGTAGLMAGGVFAAIKVAGAVHAKMRASEDEGTNYADLNRQLGNTAESFNELRSSIRGASKAVDVTFAEGSKLGMSYVRHAGIDKLGNGDLSKELGTSAGFGRSLGLDPSQSVEMFAALRHNKVSGGDNDNRKLAMMIGDTIARSGSFSKADDVLAAVTNFTQQATRASFTAANVEGFSGGLGSVLRTKFDGMDPNAASSLINRADTSIRGGGSPAMHNFMLGMMQQQMPDIDATDFGFMTDGGAFGTADKAFGENSPAMRMAKANNDNALIAKYQKMAQQGGNKTTIDRILGGMSGMSTQSMKENLKGGLGYSDSEAAAMMTAYRSNGNSISNAVNGLSKYDIDPSKLKPTSIKSILTVDNGTHDDRLGVAKYLRGLTGDQKLSGEENRLLKDAEAAPGKDDSKLKEALIKIASTRDMEMTEGDVSRKNLATLDNMASDIATKLIPMTNAIREGIVAVANVLTMGKFKDKFGETEKAKSKLEDDLAKLKTPEERGNRILEERKAIARDDGAYTDEYKKSIAARLVSAGQSIAPALTDSGKPAAIGISKSQSEFLEKTRPMADAAAAKINASGGNVKPEWLQAQWGLETGWGKSVLAGTNNIGNIKATPNWQGEKKTFNVPENRPDGSVERKNQDFKVYKTLEDAGEDYAKLLLNNPRYTKAIDARTPTAFAYQMGKSGYATDPSYGNKLSAAIQSISSNKVESSATKPAATDKSDLATKVASIGKENGVQKTSIVKPDEPITKKAIVEKDLPAPFKVAQVNPDASVIRGVSSEKSTKSETSKMAQVKWDAPDAKNADSEKPATPEVSRMAQVKDEPSTLNRALPDSTPEKMAKLNGRPSESNQSIRNISTPETIDQKIKTSGSEDGTEGFGMMQLPPGANTTSSTKTQEQMFKFMGEFTLKDMLGRPVADPIMPTPVGAPRAAGARL